MFATYLARELRRRPRQAIATICGLAIGVALVITVSSLAQGVHAAQDQVLHSLYGVGTDLTVTQAVAPGSDNGQRFGISPENRAQEGRNFTRDRLVSRGLTNFPASRTAAIAKLSGVAAASSALLLTDVQVSGQFASGDFRRPAQGSGAPTTGAAPSIPPISINSFTVEGVDLTNLSAGPLASIHAAAGRMFTNADANANVAVLSQSYANQKSLKSGSTLTIASTNFTVIGVLGANNAEVADVYIPLGIAQKLASAAGNANQIYVRASSASEIPSVQKEIQTSFPQATVTSSQTLASQITGSLSDASGLAGGLGNWLAGAVLVAAFILAILLTMAAVARRVREFGTLKALGWRGRRVAGQVVGEALVQGVAGGALGAILGVLGAFAVSRVVPTLAATIRPVAANLPGGFGGGGGFTRAFGGGPQAATRTVAVHLSTPINFDLLALAIGLAILGGLMAGLAGGLRAARLRPAEAMRRVE